MNLLTPITPIQDIISPLFKPIAITPGGNGIDRLRVDGMEFFLEFSDYSQKTTEDRIVLCKPRVMLDSYLHFFSSVSHARIVELGIFQGGSSMFLGVTLNNLEKLVAFDRSPEHPVVPGLVRKYGLADKLSLHFGTDQDSPQVAATVQKELNGQIDIVIDDCSHQYGPTRGSFQMLFPLLRPGGLYIIEDWWWAHRPRYQGKDAYWHDEPALTNFVFELAALQGSQPSWIASTTLYTYGGMVIVQKGSGAVPNPLDMNSVIQMRGRIMSHI